MPPIASNGIFSAAERRPLEKQLIEGQRLQAIGLLAGGIAHDFNNIIGAILGWAELGIEEAGAGSRLCRHFENVQHQAKHALALARQLLAFARRQPVEPRNMDLNQLVSESIGLLESVIGGCIVIEVDLAPDLAVVRADPTQIEQVLMNVCINARDAMPSGGTLVISTSNATSDAACRASQSRSRAGQYAVLSVSDTGAGMDAATLNHVFEPFFTTKEPGKGTGLGLAIVHEIVREHGGFIQVRSELNRGSAFQIYLPAS